MKNSLIQAFSILLLLSCEGKQTTEEPVADVEVQTPVTTTSISTENLTDSITLNATSAFVQDNFVKSTINGYVISVNIRQGQYTVAGKNLFKIRTKESESLGNTINKLDPSFHFTGVVNINAPQSGFITQLTHQVGDYVQDGEQLAVIANTASFGFVLNIPYEYRQYVTVGKKADVVLPDGHVLSGVVTSFLPTIDSVSQTQTAIVKVQSKFQIPENLIAKVRLLKIGKAGIISLPKEAVLADESQTNFWVMKMIDSVTAVRVDIIKGLESGSRVEIMSPRFSAADKILLTGAYGLPDTARVKIVREQE